MNSSHFSKWTPLTGMYIAATTLVCAIAVIGDLVEGLRSKQYWIPSRYTSLNSISLTILGVATKLSVDLSTTMPRHIDQLAKLGTSAFMCAALASIHPSLGKLENNELLSNTVALSILVLSSIVSLCIQLRAGVIYTFKIAHVIMLTMMSLLLLHCILSVGILSNYKSICQMNYKAQEQTVRKEWINVEDKKHIQIEKLKQYLKRSFVLGYLNCPHFLLARTSQGTPPTIYGLTATITFFVSQVTYISQGDKFLISTPGSSNSAYNWSVLWISITQTIALGVGTILLCIRGYYITMVYLKGASSSDQTQNNSDPATLYYCFDYTVYSQHKSLVCKLKMILLSRFYAFFRVFLDLTSLIVCFSIEIFLLFMTRVCSITCEPLHSLCLTTQHEDLTSEEEELSRLYISVVIGGESERSVKWMTKSILYLTQRYMSTEERNTKHIEELLRQYLSADFRGVVSFFNEEVAPLDVSQGSTANGWFLPVVTLTSIAITLPNVDPHSIDNLIKGVNEGLVLTKLIEDKFNNEPYLFSLSYAAYFEWIDAFGPACLFPMGKPTLEDKNPIELLESIVTSAKNDFDKSIVAEDNEEKVVANCKYRLCETLLVEFRNANERTIQPSTERLFQKLRATIADILGACLSNLKYYILMECSKSSSIEKVREAAPSILTFFGDTQKIMEIIETREIPEMSLEKMVFIDNWREHYRVQRQSP